MRGVTYGTFAPDTDGRLFPPERQVDDDFRSMARNGIDAVRIYTSPPRWLLNRASDHSLRVMVGLSWEDHVAFLESRSAANGILERVRAQAAECAGHPAVLCLCVGNEIPAPIVRWHGPRATEAFIERLCASAKAEDPNALVTYVNYPSTEYLELPFLDLACFNVFLESRESFGDYVARLHNVVGERPLVLTEIGLDSVRNGEAAQARHIGRQVRAAFEGGCAGAFVFSWTDDWHRGGLRIEDWGFGLTDASRKPKRSLASVRYAFAQAPIWSTHDWPRVSVVVCSRNGAATIRDCLTGIGRLDYPNLETIVVDDGSTDATAAIVAEFDVELIRTENHGLSSARNTGIEAANGDIVAFLDDDSVPDPQWLRYMASALLREEHVGVGGPNIRPTGASTLSQAIACGPGGPMHVLLSDKVAEHIPGCNMAFWKHALEAVGGFDPQFRVAGDDVDICWRLQERGWTLGFCAAAMVWHHSRPTVGSYLGQQRGYGRAEALLERKWPERYNRGGHLAWAGRVYATADVPDHAPPEPDPLRKLGEQPLPVRVRPYAGHRWAAAADAGVVLADRRSDGRGCLRRPSRSSALPRPNTGNARVADSARPLDRGTWRPGCARGRSLRAGASDFAARRRRPQRPHGRDVRAAAARPPRGAPPARTHSLAAARRRAGRRPTASHDSDLGHQLAVASGAAGQHRGIATAELHERRPRR